MSHDSAREPRAADPARRAQPERRPQAGHERAAGLSGPAAVPSLVGNAAFGRMVRDLRSGAGPRGSAGLGAASSAVFGGVAVLRSALPTQGAGPLEPEIGAAIDARRGGGAPLAEPVRAEMEGHLGIDLSAVRVHTDNAAASLNRAVQAEAFTTGTDVFFAPGRFDPSSSAGRGLLAHELTHVVQQSVGDGGPDGTVSDPADAAEREAAAVGARVARHPATSPEDARVARPAGRGGDALARIVARQERAEGASLATSTPAPPAPGTLTNQVLLDSIATLERAGSSAGVDLASEDRYRALLAERGQRVRAGHLWLRDAGAAELLRVSGNAEVARVDVVLSGPDDPRQAAGGSTTPIVSRAQLDATLARQGVPQVDLGALVGATPGDPTAPAAGAVPGPSLSPQVLGRFYPFLRPMTAAERALVADRGALHYTPESNLPTIVAPNGHIELDPSVGYRNLTDPGYRENAYFFAGEPSGAQYGANLAGGPAANTQAILMVQGADLPPGTLFRPIDSVLAVPGGYRGPAEVVPPGAAIPAGNQVVLPIPSGPASLADQLRAQGSFSGHPLAAGVGAGVIAVVLETGVVLVSTGQVPSGTQLFGAGAGGIAGGVAGAGVEQGVTRGIAATALGRSTNPMFVLLGRGGAGAAGGFIAAPIVEMTRMALDNETHTGTDYAARGTRAAVAGGVSGALAAGATAAVAGSVAPGVGTAIGFVVGVGAYLLIDWLAGSTIESGVRAAAR